MAKEIKSETIIKELFDKYPIDTSFKPSEIIDFYWGKYKEEYPTNNSINGLIFENLLVVALLREGFSPLYVQAQLSYVPSAIFDVLLYHPLNTYALSAKTTLRERWKQADLEAMALKNVHKNAKSYVLTLSHPEVAARRRLDTSYSGLDGFVLADTSELDDLIEEMKGIEFTESDKVEVVTSSDRFYNTEKLRDTFEIEF